MKKLLLFLLLIPCFIQAQTNAQGQINTTTGVNRLYISGIPRADSLVVLQYNSLGNLDMLRYNLATKKWIPRTPSQVLSDIGAASASGYVPYTGATDSLNLGSRNLRTTGRVYGATLQARDTLRPPASIIYKSSTNLNFFGSTAITDIRLGVQDHVYYDLDSNQIYPLVNNTKALGTNSNRWSSIYTTKIGNLTSNGLVTASSGNGTLGVTVPGTGVLTALGNTAGGSGGFALYGSGIGHTLTFGTHLTSGGSSFNGSADVTITSDATSANTASTIVARDGSGNFTAGTITAALSGNATTATTATNATNTAITDDNSTNATMYPTWVTANTGNLPQKVSSTGITWNPSTGIISIKGGLSLAAYGVQMSPASGTSASFVANRADNTSIAVSNYATGGSTKWVSGLVYTGSEDYVINNQAAGATDALRINTTTNVVSLAANVVVGNTTVSNPAVLGRVLNVYSASDVGIVLSSGTDDYTMGVTGNVWVVYSEGSGKMSLNSSGDLQIIGSNATKASGTAWINPSDSRLKTNIEPYTKGLREIRQVTEKVYNFNKASGYDVTTKHVSPIAQDLQKVAPEMVGTYTGELNGKKTELLNIDQSDFTPMLINSVKELADKSDAQAKEIQDLKARIIVLEKKVK